MSDYFSKMNEDYVQKHFPTGSVFANAAKTVKRRSMAALVFFLVFLAGGLCGPAWGIGRTMEFMSEGQDGVLSVGINICVFFGMIVLVSLILVCVLFKVSKKCGGCIADSAKHSKLPESEIEAFERQATASDCYVLELTAGLDRALSNAANKDGLLTRDYIYLADPARTVIRVDALRACCLADYTYYISTGKCSTKIHCLAIYLLASNGVSVLSDTTEEAGQALMALLKKRNGAIDTNVGKVLPESAFDDYKKSAQVLSTRGKGSDQTAWKSPKARQGWWHRHRTDCAYAF